jgi:hypothetical protein
VEFGLGYKLDIQPDSVTPSMLDSTDTPASGECVTINADLTSFNFDACSGAAQPASNVSVDTTAFDGNFANDTSHDSAQELFDKIDDFSLSGIAQTDIDTLAELNTVVTDATLVATTNIDTLSKLNTILTDATLIDGGVDTTGTPAATYIPFFSDANTLGSSANFVYDGTDLVVANSANQLIKGVVTSDSNAYTSVIGKVVMATPATGIPLNRVLFRFEGWGHDGTFEDMGAAVLFRASEEWTGSAHGTSLVFKTNLNGSTTDIGRIILDGNGTTTMSDLAGTYSGGSAYVCVYDSGVIYASETACP